MGFVNGNQAYRHFLNPSLEHFRLDALRGQIQKFDFPIGAIVKGHVYFASAHTRVDGNGLNPPPSELAHLVLHQSDQRGNHQAHPLHQQGRHLKANGFSPTRGQKGKGILSCQHMVDNIFLWRAKPVITPILPQYVPGGFHLPIVYQATFPLLRKAAIPRLQSSVPLAWAFILAA